MSFDNNSFKYNKVNYTTNCIFYTNEDRSNNVPLAHVSFKNLEEKHVEIVAQNKGHILEIGFGLGCSSNKFIELGVESLTCIEINDVIYQHALKWAKDKPNVTIINGAWEEVVPTLTTKYDGIYYSSSLVQHALFYELCKPLCKKGTIISAQGYIFDMSPDKANAEDNIAPPHIYDDIFTESLYNDLIYKGYYKVYWNIFNGIDYVKYLEK